MYHVAAFDGDTIRVTDVWESAEQFQKFAESKLMPATQQLGITSQPDVKLLPIHSILAFGYNAK
jgi:heme-degrading monooxygenase HmoA